MNNIKFKLISVFFKLKSTLKQELGKDMSHQVDLPPESCTNV